MQHLHLLLEAVERLIPGTHPRLNGPAAQHDLIQLEELIGAPLPADVRAIYEVNDGEADNFVPGIIFNLKFLPVREVQRLVREFRELRKSGIHPTEDVPDDQRLKTQFPSVTLASGYRMKKRKFSTGGVSPSGRSPRTVRTSQYKPSTSWAIPRASCKPCVRNDRRWTMITRHVNSGAEGH